MTPLNKHLATFALLLGATALPAMATSSATSSVSESVGALVGSVSGSITKSSGSSSKTDVAAGDYKIIDMAAVADQPGMVRLTLQAQDGTGAEGDFVLLLPQAAVANGKLAAGHVVSARTRPYGLEFASQATQQAFFLVLADSWYQELQSRAVVL